MKGKGCAVFCPAARHILMKFNKSIDTVAIDFEGFEEIVDERLPDPDTLRYYRMLNRREILWNDDIQDYTLSIALAIREWNLEDKGKAPDERKPIKIMINSDGGSVNAVMHIVDMIKLSKTPVITIGLGKVYSAGGLLLMAGHRRYVFENTSCLIHDGSSGAIGDTGKLMDNLKFTEKQEARIREYILANTRISAKEYDKNYRRDWFLFSDEIIKYGIADAIVTDLDEIL